MPGGASKKLSHNLQRVIGNAFLVSFVVGSFHQERRKESNPKNQCHRRDHVQLGISATIFPFGYGLARERSDPAIMACEFARRATAEYEVRNDLHESRAFDPHFAEDLGSGGCIRT